VLELALVPCAWTRSTPSDRISSFTLAHFVTSKGQGKKKNYRLKMTSIQVLHQTQQMGFTTPDLPLTDAFQYLYFFIARRIHFARL